VSACVHWFGILTLWTMHDAPVQLIYDPVAVSICVQQCQVNCHYKMQLVASCLSISAMALFFSASVKYKLHRWTWYCATHN